MKKVVILFVVLLAFLSVSETKAKECQILGFGTLEQVIYSPDGNKIASCGSEGIFIWDIESGDTTLTIRDNKFPINYLAFSPDGNKIAALSIDSTIRIWNTATGEKLNEIYVSLGNVIRLIFSPDGEYILTNIRAKNKLMLWDLSTNEVTTTFEGHEYYIPDFCFSPDGKKILSCGYEKKIMLWDAKTGDLLKILAELPEYVISVAYSPDGSKIASGSYDKKILLWDAITGQFIRYLDTTFYNRGDVRFNSDGSGVASMCDDNSIKIWNVNSGEVYKTFMNYSNRFKNFRFSPKGLNIVTADNYNTIDFWDINSEIVIKSIHQHTNKIKRLCFSPDGWEILSTEFGVKIWDFYIGTILNNFQVLVDYENLCYSPDGVYIACGSKKSPWDARILDANTGLEIFNLLHHSGNIESICFSPDGNYLATGGADSTINLWYLKTGDLIQTFFGHKSAVQNLHFSPDGDTLSSAGTSNKTTRIIVWNVKTANEIRTVSINFPVSCIKFNNDGSKLIGTTNFSKIRIFDAFSGNELINFKSKNDSITELCYNSDETKIACSSLDKTVRLYNANSGELLQTFTGHRTGATSVCFNPDGTKIASGSEDGTIRIWNLEPNAIKDASENQENTLSISPNPANDEITVSLDNSEGSEIQIYNPLGEIVLSVGTGRDLSAKINISDLPKGIYFVKVGSETAKFVKM